MTIHLVAELPPESIIATVAAALPRGTRINRTPRLQTAWETQRVVHPGQTALVICDYMGDVQLQELRWDGLERGELRTIGFMDGFRPSLAYRCLIPASAVAHPNRLGSDELHSLDLTNNCREHGALWLAGALLPPDGAGRRVFNVLTAPVNEGRAATGFVEPMIIASKHWAHWLNPQYSSGLLQHSPTEMRGRVLHLAA